VRVHRLGEPAQQRASRSERVCASLCEHKDGRGLNWRGLAPRRDDARSTRALAHQEHAADRGIPRRHATRFAQNGLLRRDRVRPRSFLTADDCNTCPPQSDVEHHALSMRRAGRLPDRVARSTVSPSNNVFWSWKWIRCKRDMTKTKTVSPRECSPQSDVRKGARGTGVPLDSALALAHRRSAGEARALGLGAQPRARCDRRPARS